MQIISPSIKEWQNFVEGLPEYSFFHLPIWASAHEKTYSKCKVATKIFIFEDGIKILVPLVEVNSKFGLKIYESQPAGIYGGMLWDKEPSIEQMEGILTYLTSARTLHLGIYPDPLQPEVQKALDPLTGRLKSFLSYAHILKLDGGYEEVWKKRITRKNRNQTRKAQKTGVLIREDNSIDGIKSFFSLYLASVERWELREYYPFEFHRNLFELGGNRIKLHLASKDGRDIAGTIHFYGNSEVFFWHAAMLKEYGEYCPNNLLLNGVIRDACERGYKYYNMGSSGGLTGVEQFKKSFGAEKQDYRYFVYESQLLKVYKMVNSALRLKIKRKHSPKVAK